MGEVYKASDRRRGEERGRREAGIKGVPAGCAADPERLARFDREAQALAALNHPNIAAIYGLEESRGSPFLVLELVPGETLAERLAAGPLPIGETFAGFRQGPARPGAAHGA